MATAEIFQEQRAFLVDDDAEGALLVLLQEQHDRLVEIGIEQLRNGIDQTWSQRVTHVTPMMPRMKRPAKGDQPA